MLLPKTHVSATVSQGEFPSELRSLSDRYREHPAPLGDFLDTLRPRASALLVVICSLLFSTPIGIPGLSMPFGFVILLLAARCFLGVPNRLRRVLLPGEFFTHLLAAGSKLVGWLERRMEAQLHILADADWKLRFHTTVVIVAASPCWVAVHDFLQQNVFLNFSPT